MRRISPEKFIIKEVPTLNPLGLEYRNYWRGFKKKCIEGEWVEGVWIPGNLWFYLNACVIELNKTRILHLELMDYIEYKLLICLQHQLLF